MVDLNDFRYFVRIVECGGLTAASRNLDEPKSTVSHRLQQLEAALGVRLINRTSRSLSMTDAGGLFYRHAVAMLERADLAENAVRERLAEPSGTIRFTTAVMTSIYAVRPLLPQFIRRHPKINVVLHTTDEQVDIVGGSYDLALRAHTGPLSDSMLVQRTLAPAPWFLYASPAYLERRGIPVCPEDLTAHDTLIMSRPGHPLIWRLKHPTRGELPVPVEPRLSGNDLVMLKHAAHEGIGIAALPGYVCRDEVQAGGLKRVLPDWLAGEASITAVIPFRHGLLPSVRTFLDFLAENIPKVVAT
jgi:DNA-binding transcriptional LysR family regulator